MKPLEVTKIFLFAVILVSLVVFTSTAFAQNTTTTTQTTTTSATSTATTSTSTTSTTAAPATTTQTTTTTAAPTTTTTTQQACTKEQLGYCKTQSECQAAGGYWTVYGSCSPQPQDKSTCSSAGRYWCGTDASGYCQSGPCPQCSKTYPSYCYTENDCKGAGLYWCGNHCQTSSCPTCSSSQKYNCFTDIDCKNAGGQWCATWPPGTGNNYCTDSCPATTTTTTTTVAKCPTPPSQPTCSSGQFLKPKYDSAGCILGYECASTTTPVCGNRICESGETPTSCPSDCQISTGCPAPPSYPACPSGQYAKPKYDISNCLTNYECTTSGVIELCPQVPPPTISCPSDQQLSKTTDDKGCIVGYNCVTVGQPSTKPTCPLIPLTKPLCPNGNVVPIFTDAGCLVGFNCIPQGCRQELDPKTQVNRVVCEQAAKCQSDFEIQSLGNKCAAQGGRIVSFTNPNGCKSLDCRFTQEEVSPDPLKGHAKCPSESEINNAIKSCTATGLSPTITFEGGCKIAKCGQQREESCRIPTSEEKSQLENQCSAKGLPIIKDVNTNGCPFYRCGETKQETCVKEIPAEVFGKCQSIGGEIIVKKDQNACVVYFNCITRGDERDSYVAPVKEVPDPTQLLQIALKLEQLKVELKKLSAQAKDIAAYYAGSGDADEERFNRVASMFDAASDRIDEIRSTIKNKLNSLTTDDLLQIKGNIKQLKDVTLKDLVYVMLSNSDDVKKIISSSKKLSVTSSKIEDVEKVGDNCGTDSSCFDKAFRVCKPLVFKPEGSAGPTMIIVGLDGDNCIIKASMPEDQAPKTTIKPPYEMTCRIKDYSFGMQGPKQFLDNCQGSMAELFKQSGGATVSAGTKGFPPPEGGPGGCKTIEECSKYCSNNHDSCEKWVKEHPEYSTNSQSNQGFQGPSQSGQSGFGGQQQITQRIATPASQIQQPKAQACAGCLNNGVCDIGECSECVDCLKR